MNIETRVLRVLSEQLGTDIPKPEDSLTDQLGADSLDLIEVVMAIEEEFEIEISDSEAEECRTGADIIALVTKKVS